MKMIDKARSRCRRNPDATRSNDGKGTTTANGYNIDWKPSHKAAYTGKEIAGSYRAWFYDRYHNSSIGQSGFETRAKAEAWARSRCPNPKRLSRGGYLRNPITFRGETYTENRSNKKFIRAWQEFFARNSLRSKSGDMFIVDGDWYWQQIPIDTRKVAREALRKLRQGYYAR